MITLGNMAMFNVVKCNDPDSQCSEAATTGQTGRDNVRRNRRNLVKASCFVAFTCRKAQTYAGKHISELSASFQRMGQEIDREAKRAWLAIVRDTAFCQRLFQICQPFAINYSKAHSGVKRIFRATRMRRPRGSPESVPSGPRIRRRRRPPPGSRGARVPSAGGRPPSRPGSARATTAG